MTVKYVLKRIGTFFLVVWVTLTINFILPRLAPGDPMQDIVGRLTMQGASIEDSAKLIESYRRLFGLDDPIIVQYGRYVLAMSRLEMGYSLAYFPSTVMDILRHAIPYTLGLLSVTTLLTFGLGILVGALLSWRTTPRSVRIFLNFFMALAPVPYYLLALLLMFAFSFKLHWFPSGGVTSVGRIAQEGFSSADVLDTLYHSVLPASSIILSSIGVWAIGMRGMMVTVLGEDYLTLADAKGLPGRRVFFSYALRNAMLPQFTSLAISLGYVVSGSTLVEMMFSYPGVGYLLYRSIASSDYTVMQGISFFLVVAVALAVLIVDLIYPWLDPRITYERR